MLGKSFIQQMASNGGSVRAAKLHAGCLSADISSTDIAVEKRRQAWRPREPERVLSVKGPDGNNRAGEFDMRTFIAGTTKVHIIAHISREDLEPEGLVLHRFEDLRALRMRLSKRSSIATAAGP